MTSEEAPLKAIVRHDGRLDVLCCLLDGVPLAVGHLSAMTAMPPDAIRYYVGLLRRFGLVAEVHSDGEEPLYVLTLDGHPDWVQEAIEEHRCRD